MFLRGIPLISLSNVIFNEKLREEDRGVFWRKGCSVESLNV